MKKILIATAVLAFGVNYGHAQDVQQAQSNNSQVKMTSMSAPKRDPQAVAAARATKLEKELDLTADQKQKITDIFLEESQNKNRAVARTEGETKIKAVLTKEQITKFDALKAKRTGAMQARAAN